MSKLSTAALALPFLAAAFTPVAAGAAGSAYYRAELANPAPKAKFVARDVVWACDGVHCVAGRGTSRPLIMCASLARVAGEVKSFTVDGAAITPEDLARCNGK